MDLISRWIINAVAVWVTASVVPGVTVNGPFAALVVAVVLGILNSFVRPILLFLTLPITILTLGLFALVINTLMILLAAKIVPGFAVSSFWWALVFGAVLWLVNVVLHKMSR